MTWSLIWLVGRSVGSLLSCSVAVSVGGGKVAGKKVERGGRGVRTELGGRSRCSSCYAVEEAVLDIEIEVSK